MRRTIDAIRSRLRPRGSGSVVPLSLRASALRELWASGHSLTILVALLALVTSALPVVRIVAVGDLLGHVARSGSGASTGVSGALVVVGVVLVAEVILQSCREAVATVAGRRAGRRLRTGALSLVNAPSGIAHLEDPDMQNDLGLINAMSASHYPLEGALTGTVALTTSQLAVAGPAALLVGFRWWVVPPLLAAQWWMTRVYGSETRRRMEVLGAQGDGLRRAEYFAELGMSPVAGKEIRVFGLADWVTEQFRGSWLSAMTAVWHERRSSRRPLIVAATVSAVIHTAVFVVIADAASDRALDVAGLVIVVQAVLATGAAFGQEAGAYGIAFGLAPLGAFHRVSERVSAAAHLEGPRPSPEPSPHGARPGPPEISLDGVTFAYPRGDRRILDDLHLTLHAGKSAALVGLNGTGKTTLVKLLLGLYEPTSGVVRIDGRPLSPLEAPGWWPRVGVLFQDFLRYPDTAMFNVDPTGADRSPLVGHRRAAGRAGALELIEGLEHGWQTVLSRQFGGTELSGGQWQRVALTRALAAVEAGASFLVLDEPTAHLDVRAEAAFYDQFLDLTRGLTTLIISHRFSTVRSADVIAVIDDGRVVESGNHGQLLEAEGRYARMFRQQASAFETGPA